MLSHYSALKIAETFNVLQSFYPDRIELGIGRAPGSDRNTAIALSYPKTVANIQEFPQQVSDLIGFLSGSLPADHIFSNIKSQAQFLNKTTPIPNDVGTALGIYIKKKNINIFVLPGVPSEVKIMFKKHDIWRHQSLGTIKSYFDIKNNKI